MTDAYPFSAEPPVVRTPLGRAIRHCESAITAVILARASDGIRRDQTLRDAIDNLTIAISLIEGAVVPPVPPAVAQRADMFAIACAITGADVVTEQAA